MKTLKQILMLALLLFASTSWAATIYVSNTTSNGFTTGSDSNTYTQAQSMATPYLTITKATSSSVSNGDTIVVNDGTYTMGSGGEGNYIEPARTGLILKSGYDVSIAGCIKWGPVLVGLAGQARVFRISAGGDFTIGTITINANNIANCIDCNDIDQTTLTIHGTRLMNPTNSWIYAGTRLRNLVMDGNWYATSSATGNFNGFYMSGAQSSNGTYNITSGTAIHDSTDAASTSIILRCNPTNTGLTININNVSLTNTGNGSGAGTVYGAYIGSVCTSVSITNSNFTLNGTSTNGYAIYTNNTIIAPITLSGTTLNLNGTYTYLYGVYTSSGASGSFSGTNNIFNSSATANTLRGVNLAGGPVSVLFMGNTFDYSGSTISFTKFAFGILGSPSVTSSCVIKNNSGNLGNAAVGMAIQIGNDSNSNTNAYNINGIEISGNDFTNTDHGYFIGWQTDAVVTKNKITNCIIGLISKHATNAIFSHNIVIGGANNVTGGALRDKAGDRATFYNNTFISNGTADVFIMTTQSDDMVQSTNSIFKNNVCYGSATSTLLKYVSLENTSTIRDINNNCYYSAGALNANPWTYQASNYATFATWKAGQSIDANSLNIDPKLTSSTNVILLSSSPCINAGSFGLGLTTDYVGNNIIGPPDIGAYEYQFTGGHLTLAAP